MIDRFDNIRVILADPRDSRNIGAVCRAMKTMGLTRLAVVGGGTVDWRDAAAVAVHAGDVLDSATRYSSLAGAIGDASLSAGVTRRRGKRRKYFALTPEQLAAKVREVGGGEVALVFGNEVSGLTDEELSCCHLAVSIPTSTLFPSLNLSHAVQIVGYAIFTELNSGSLPRYRPVTNTRLSELVSVIVRSLECVGFFSQVGTQDMSVFFKDMLGRAQLSGREADRLELIFRKIAGLMTNAGIDS